MLSEALARHGGWLRWARVKRIQARIRQGQILALARKGDLDLDARLGRTYVYRALAARLNVGQTTIRRDLKALLSRSPVCPLCGQDVPQPAQSTPQSKQDKKIK